jgi:hypothetical protein
MAKVTASKPETTEFVPYYGRYISLVPEGDVLVTLERQLEDMSSLARNTPESEGNKRHPPYTWSVKEVVGHLIDSERVFGYRALRFARNDATALPGFEENDFVRNGEFDAIPLRELVEELEAVRRSHLPFFQHLKEEAWLRRGTANGNSMSVRAVAFVIAGHTNHHLGILRKRLGQQ